MYSVRFQRTNKSVLPSNHGFRGYYLTELILSALLIAATAVLAFPTYQDFQPHIDLVDENSVGTMRESVEDPGETSTAQVSASQTNELMPVHEDRDEDVVAARMESGER